MTLAALGKDANEVQALFITTDPKRDTAKVMRDYISNFGGDIAGLVGTPKEIEMAMKSFRMVATKIDIENEAIYQMDHPAIIFFMDKDGKYLQTLPSSGKAEDLASEIRQVLKKT